MKAGADTAPTAGRAWPGWDRDRDKATCLSPCLKGPSPAPCPLSTRGPGAAPGSGHSSSLPSLTGAETSAPPQPPPLTPSLLPCPSRSATLQSSGLQLQPPRPSLRHANHGIWGEGASWEPTSHSFFPVWGDVWGQGARTGGGCLKGPCRSRSNNRHRNSPTRLFQRLSEHQAEHPRSTGTHTPTDRPADTTCAETPPLLLWRLKAEREGAPFAFSPFHCSSALNLAMPGGWGPLWGHHAWPRAPGSRSSASSHRKPTTGSALTVLLRPLCCWRCQKKKTVQVN